MTSVETVAGSIPNSSMMLGSATASIVELSGTSTAPLATPSIAGLRSRAVARYRHSRRTEPAAAVELDQPSIRDPRRRVAGPDDGGQAELACHDRGVREHAAGVGDEPPAIAKSGTQEGFDDGQTMMSPCWTRAKSA